MYKIKNILKLLCFIGLSMLLISCTLPQDVTLYNNTGSPIEVTFIVSGEKKHILIINAGEIQTYRIGMVTPYDILAIAINNNIWRYELVELRNSFWSYEGIGPFLKIVFKLQIESDGKIYILPKDSDYPFNITAKQPYDYLLLPMN